MLDLKKTIHLLEFILVDNIILFKKIPFENSRNSGTLKRRWYSSEDNWVFHRTNVLNAATLREGAAKQKNLTLGSCVSVPSSLACVLSVFFSIFSLVFATPLSQGEPSNHPEKE
jgi:hypothetical protein